MFVNYIKPKYTMYYNNIKYWYYSILYYNALNHIYSVALIQIYMLNDIIILMNPNPNPMAVENALNPANPNPMAIENALNPA